MVELSNDQIEKYKNVKFSDKFYSKFIPKMWNVESVKIFYIKKLDKLIEYHLTINNSIINNDLDDIIIGNVYIDIVFSNPNFKIKEISNNSYCYEE